MQSKLKYTSASDADIYRIGDHLRIDRVILVPIVRLYRVWLQSNGPQTTVSRLKTIKVGLLTGVIDNDGSETWISVSRGKIKGPFRPLFCGWFGLEKALQLMQVLSSSIKLSRLSSRQWKKFQCSAEKEPVFISLKRDAPEMADLLPEAIRKLFPRTEVLKNIFAESRHDSPFVWIDKKTDDPPLGDEFSVQQLEDYQEAVPPLEDVWETMPIVIPLKQCTSAVKNYRLGTGLPYEYVRDARYLARFARSPMCQSGAIAVLQERGCKARVIANPLKCHQMALSKLSNILMKVLRLIPQDCTYNQMEASERLCQELKSGKPMYCFDLSDASNNIPRAFVDEVLRELVNRFPQEQREELHAMLDLFFWINNGEWNIPEGMAKAAFVNQPKSSVYLNEHSVLKFKVGTALGLNAAWPAWAISHNIAVVLVELSKRVVGNRYAIIGDDLWLSHPIVANGYKQFVGGILDVPISKTKSIVSSTIGEIAGQIVTKDGPLKVEKWKYVDSLDGAVSMYKWLGPVARLLLPRQYRSRADFIAHLPSPLGMGINPKGLPLYDRLPDEAMLLYEASLQGYTPLPISSVQRKTVERRAEIADVFIHFRHLAVRAYEPLARRPDETDSVAGRFINLIGKLTAGHLPKWAETVKASLLVPSRVNFYQELFWKGPLKSLVAIFHKLRKSGKARNFGHRAEKTKVTLRNDAN